MAGKAKLMVVFAVFDEVITEFSVATPRRLERESKLSSIFTDVDWTGGRRVGE